MAGIVGEGFGEQSVAVDLLWIAYCKLYQKHTAEERQVVVLPEFAEWSLDDKPIKRPTSAFLTFNTQHSTNMNKYICTTTTEEGVSERKGRAAKKAKLLELIARKQDENLEGLSIAELTKQFDELG